MLRRLAIHCPTLFFPFSFYCVNYNRYSEVGHDASKDTVHRSLLSVLYGTNKACRVTAANAARTRTYAGVGSGGGKGFIGPATFCCLSFFCFYNFVLSPRLIHQHIVRVYLVSISLCLSCRSFSPVFFFYFYFPFRTSNEGSYCVLLSRYLFSNRTQLPVRKTRE